MMNLFEHPEYLYALGLIPLLMVWHYLYRRRQAKVFSQLKGDQFAKNQYFNRNGYRQLIRFLFILLAFAALITALAGPYTTRKSHVTAIAKKRQIVFAIDVSASMLARDVTPSRLLKAQSFIVNVLANLHRNEQVAVVIFAGRADTYVPLTTDYQFVKKEVTAIAVNQSAMPGTSINDALKISSLVLNSDPDAIRTICVLSDGEAPDPNIDGAAAKVYKSGINLFALGLGTNSGANIIEKNDNGIEKIKLAKDGTPVITRLHDENLKKLVGNNPGNYYLLEDPHQAADHFIAATDKLQLNGQTFVFTPQKWFQYFLLGAFLLLFIEILIN